MMKRFACLALALVIMAVLLSCGAPSASPAPTPVPALELHVAPGGNDANSGSNASPFQTLGRARDAVRAAILTGMSSDIVVLVHAGQYKMDSALKLGAGDGGRGGFTVTWRGAGDGDAVLTGNDGNIIEIVGPSRESPVEGIRLERLTLKQCKGAADDGEDDGEFAGNGILLENAQNITVYGCRISGVSGNGVYLHHYAQQNSIEGCEISATGRNGIYLRGIFYSGSKSNYNKDNTITNNHIFDTGISGVESWQSNGNTISHNRIHDTGKYCVSFNTVRPGEMYNHTIDGVKLDDKNGRNFRNSGNNLCEYNDFSNANRTADDTGMVEGWGAAPGNIVRNNYFHGKASDGGWVFVVYLDDASDGFTVENNLIAGIPTAESAVFAKGIGNKIINNLIADNGFHTVFLSQNLAGEGNRDLEFLHNVVYESGNKLFTFYNWEEGRVSHCDNNLYFSAGSNGVYFVDGAASAPDYASWRSVMGFDARSLTDVDPLLTDPAGFDYRPCYDSPVYAVGFRDFNLQDIGLAADYPFANAADSLERVYVRRVGDEANASWFTAKAGESAQLELLGRTIDGFVADLSGAFITYASSASTVASVDENGTVKALEKGIATIKVTAKAGTVEKHTSIDVLVDDAVTGLEVKAGGSTLLTGSTVPVSVYAQYVSGRRVLLEPASYTLTVEGSALALDSSAIRAVQAGSGSIAAKAVLDSVEVSGKTDMVVADTMLARLQIAFSDPVIQIGEKTDVVVTAYDNTGARMAVPVGAVKLMVEGRTVLLDGTTLTGSAAGSSRVLAQVTLDGATVSSSAELLVQPKASTLPGGWKVSNYGGSEGFAAAEGGRFTLYSTGMDVFGAEDDTTFVHTSVLGTKFAVQAKLESLSDIGDKDSAAGIMVRAGDGAADWNINIRVLPGGEVRLVYRNDQNVECNYAEPKGSPNLTMPAALKLERDGNSFTGYYQADGQWVKVASVEINMGKTVQVGMIAFSHEKGRSISAILSEMTIQPE
jgi:hypothetical protein